MGFLKKISHVHCCKWVVVVVDVQVFFCLWGGGGGGGVKLLDTIQACVGVVL